MTKILSTFFKIFMLWIMSFTYVAFSDDFDDIISQYAILANKKSDLILTGKLSDRAQKKYDNVLNNFVLKNIERNNVDNFYKVICSDLKFIFLYNLKSWLNIKANDAQKKECIATLLKLHELLISNGHFDEDEQLQNLLLSYADDDKLYPSAVKDIIKRNLLSGSLAPIFSEIMDLYKDKDIKKYFNLSTSHIGSQTINHSTLYHFCIFAIQARHGDYAALKILIDKLHSLAYNDEQGIRHVPRLLCYSNQQEAISQMINVYGKADLRPNKEDSLYNYCACSLNLLVSNFPPGNLFLGVIGDNVKDGLFQKWVKEKKINI